VPILKTLYNAADRTNHHIYMSLIILLILTEDDLFNASVHDQVLNFDEKSYSFSTCFSIVIHFSERQRNRLVHRTNTRRNFPWRLIYPCCNKDYSTQHVEDEGKTYFSLFLKLLKMTEAKLFFKSKTKEDLFSTGQISSYELLSCSS
jgi:hypothetical protein